jgi:hypothetical protein
MDTNDTASPQHWSDCAVHNGPALAPSGCDCGGYPGSDEAWDAIAPRWNGCVHICDLGHAHDFRGGAACNARHRALAARPAGEGAGHA